MNDYTIKSGDCLWDIAKRQYNTSNNEEITQIVNKLLEVNDLSNSNLIHAGNTLKLPDTESIFGTGNDASGENYGDVFVNKNQDEGLLEDESVPISGNNGAEAGIYEKLNLWTKDVNGAAEMYAIQKMGDTQYASDIEEYMAFEQYYSEAVSIADKQTGFQYADADTVGESTQNKFMASQELAQEHIAQFDTDENSSISQEEFINGSLAEYEEAYGQKITVDSLDSETAKQLEASFNFFDLNNDGSIDTAETMAYYTTMDALDGSVDGNIKFGSTNTMSTLSTEADNNQQKAELKDIMGGFYTNLKNFITE